MVLGSYVLEDLAKIKEMVSKGISFEVAEYVVLGQTTRPSARGYSKLVLPQELVNAVRWHHDPDSCESHCMLSDVVHVANIMSCCIGLREGLQRPGCGALILRSSNVSASPRTTSTNSPSRPAGDEQAGGDPELTESRSSSASGSSRFDAHRSGFPAGRRLEVPSGFLLSPGRCRLHPLDEDVQAESALI